MASRTLAVKYRPKTWESVTEQSSIKIILQQQLESGEIKNAYLFTGPAGCGKTTSARIFAHDINKGQGNPIEMDAASNSGVDDVRNIIQQAQTKSLDSEYKVFIIDECHSISNTGWQAFLKLIEEPPAKSIFIFCTTNPERIPKTILSRVQRYDFTKISQDGIVGRLMLIANEEKEIDDSINWYGDTLEYIAKISEGGMREAISLMDKALAYSKDLTLENVVKALGTTDYETMFSLADAICGNKNEDVITTIEQLYNDGKDIKRFVKQFTQFLLDVQKYDIMGDKAWSYMNIPKLADYESELNSWGDYEYTTMFDLLDIFEKLNSDIKYSSVPKYDVEIAILLFMRNSNVD